MKSTRAENEITVEFEPGELGSGRYLVPATIDGQAYSFQLDTGSSYTTVDHDAFTGAYPAVGDMNRISAAGEIRRDEKIQVKRLSLGNLSHDNFEVVRHGATAPQGNRLGMNAFTSERFEFLPGRGFIRLDADPLAPEGTYPLFSYPSGTFGLEVRVNDRETEALWDTGAELSCVNRDLVEAHPELFTLLQEVEGGIDATGAPVPMQLVHCPGFSFGGTAAPAEFLAIDFSMVHERLSSDLHFILGTNLIDPYYWHFDRAAARFQVTAPTPRRA